MANYVVLYSTRFGIDSSFTSFPVLIMDNLEDLVDHSYSNLENDPFGISAGDAG